MRLAHQFAERRPAVEGIEQITERARENALDADDLVAAGDEVPERRHDRQAGADIGFEQEVLLALLEVGE